METNQANVQKNMETKFTNLKKNTADLKTDIEGKLEAVNHEVKGLKAALIKSFNETEGRSCQDGWEDRREHKKSKKCTKWLW